MKKIYILILFTSVSLFLLFIQIGLLKHSFGQSWAKPPNFRYVSQKNAKEILKIAAKFQVPLFPVDAPLLQKIHNGSQPSSLCEFVCSSKVLPLATFSKFLEYKPNFYEEVQKAGFEIITTEGLNRRLLQHGYHVSVPCHLVFIRWGHAVHIPIFYEREVGYWWHCALVWNDTLKRHLKEHNLSENDFTFAAYEGAYSRFEVMPVRLYGLPLHLPVNIPAFLSLISQSRFKECNVTRAKSFHDQYGKDISAEAMEFKSDAWRLLAKTKSLLDDLSLRFWLSSGTCLGYFRQCDIIPYSKDVDIGIWITDYDPRLISTLSSHGLSLKHMFGRINDSFELSFQDGDVKLDIFFFYEEDNHMWNGGTQARTGKKFKYIFPKFTLCWTEFLELKVRVPCETESYIIANYGPFWSIPQKTWDWKKNPPNVKENGLWPEEEWPQVIQVVQFPGQ